MKSRNQLPAFITERLVVFCTRMRISGILCANRRLYTAFPAEKDDPNLVCHMLLMSMGSMHKGAWMVDWINTDERYRRQGFAAELWRGVDNHLGPDAHIMAHGVSKAGKALCRKMSDELLQETRS